MFYFVWVLATFCIGQLSYNFGERYGRKFVATVLSHELENTIADNLSPGGVYQRIKFATSQYL